MSNGYIDSGTSFAAPHVTGIIAIAWLRRNTNSGTNHTSVNNAPFVNFDLYVKDVNGNTVYSSTSIHDSVEMVRFHTSTTNKYTVEVKRNGTGSSVEKISLAHVRD